MHTWDTLSTATETLSALVTWHEGFCSYSVMGKEIWVMLRAELLQTGSIYLSQVQILFYWGQLHQQGNHKHNE